MNASPALRRMRASAARILRQQGGEIRVQRFAATKDRKAGSQSWNPVGAPVRLAGAVHFEEVKKEGGVRERVEMIHLEADDQKLPAGLSDDFQVEIDGAFRRIEGSALSEDSTYWEATVCRGL